MVQQSVSSGWRSHRNPNSAYALALVGLRPARNLPAAGQSCVRGIFPHYPTCAAKCFLPPDYGITLTLGMLRPLQQLRRATLHALSHDVLTLARAAAYSAILGLFPALLVVTTVVALVPQGDTLMGEIRSALADFLPGNAIDAIQDYFNSRHVRSLQAVSSAVLVTLFGCMGLMTSFMQGFRRAFAAPVFDDVRTEWNPKRERLTALVLIPSCLVPMALSTALVAFGHQIEEWVVDVTAHGFKPYVLFLWRMSRWSIAILCTAVVLAVIYRFGTPRRQSWRDVHARRRHVRRRLVRHDLGVRLVCHAFRGLHHHLRLARHRRRHSGVALHHGARRFPGCGIQRAGRSRSHRPG